MQNMKESMHKKSITLIKLGGSIITNKEVPMSIRRDVLSRLVDEIARAKKENPDRLFIVGHGSGSFGHVPASRYGTMHGFKQVAAAEDGQDPESESKLGMAIVQDSAAQLNRAVVHAFIEKGIPAVSLLPSNVLVTKKRAVASYFPDVFEWYLRQGLFPVMQGDVVVDQEQGCTIWSTEEVLSFFAQEFAKRDWHVQQIVHVTEVKGVLDLQGEIIPEVTPDNAEHVRTLITPTKGFDVTGGMWLKIKESLDLTHLGISSVIISGMLKGNLYNCLTEKEAVGTIIKASQKQSI